MFRVLRAAQGDVRAITAWYQKQRDGLQLEFLDDFEQALESVESDPSRLAAEESNPTPSDVRYKSLRRFPYRILVEVDGADAAVIAVIHHHRRPGFWSGRAGRM
jgi:plasmid stabilization system protein ParE